jgi:O-acetyl-ADP-ribose deacetylase (regulator of RNase III)
MHSTIGRTLLELVEGNIAEQDTDAVVTAAHWDLKGGQGADGSIHYRAGRQLLEACRQIGACPIGDAMITPCFKLKATAAAYQNSLRVAVENCLKSVSFPSISTDAFNYPLSLAAPIALRAIIAFLEIQPHDLDRVRMVLYSREMPEAYDIYARALRQMREVSE